jgi:Tfp pilus assembly protein PilN
LRPVNLIPADQRRGGRRVGAGRPGAGGLVVYGFLGVLGFALIAVFALVLTSNRINDRKSSVSDLQQEAASAQAAADALRPYGNFAQLQRARVDTVNSLVNSAFNWERVLRQVSRTIPSDVWLTSLTATVAPDVDVASGEGGGGGTSGLRSKADSPAVSVTGCTYSHNAVARMMTRMRNLDGVTDVVLSGSERPTGNVQDQSSTSSSEGGGGGGGSSADCRTKYRITKFDIVVVLGEAPFSKPAPPAAAAPTTPVASAQAAVATSQQASASAGGGQ